MGYLSERKFKLSQMVSAGPALVKYQFALTSTLPYTNCQRKLLFDTPRSTPIQQAEITQLLQASIGSPKHSVRSASSHTTPTHAAPRVPFLQRRITIPTSDQTPVPGPALHPHPQGTSTDYPRLLLLGLPSGQTQFRGLSLLLLEQSAAVHTPPPLVSAQLRLPVQLLARQPRIQILTHHLIRRTPFRPPVLIHRGPLQLAITACACPRHTCSAAHNQGPI